jgi:two-component sensor histidine kinase
MSSEQLAVPVWEEGRLRAANKAAGVALWAWNVDTDTIVMDERGYVMWGVPKDQETTFQGLSRHIHPIDLDRVRADFSATRAIVGPYETDFRILFENEIRWISARGQGDDVDISNRLMFGIFLDVTQRKQGEEANELLAGEMSHRVKNLLMIAAALTRSVSQSAETKEEMVRNLTNRLIALGRAHELVHSVPSQEDKEVLLGDLFAVLLAPYDNDKEASHGRIRISVPKIAVGSTAATTLALVLHELATNSLKYGTLSSPKGTINVSAAPYVGEEIVVVWTEQGGPPVVPPKATPTGFGSEMVRRGMSSRLGGSIAFNWANEGVIVTLRMSKSSLMA